MWVLALSAVVMGSKASTPTKLIIDTDAGFDVDDVGAVCLGNALQVRHTWNHQDPTTPRRVSSVRPI